MNNVKRNRLKDKIFKGWGLFSSFVGLMILALFLINIVIDSWSMLSWDFLTNLPSRRPTEAGIYTAIMGTLWVLPITAMVAFPIGVAAGVYLEEYSKKNRFSSFIEINIANLAGVPSIIYGLLGMGIFGRMMNLGNSLLAGSFTLALLILPIIIVSTREAIKAVPKTIKEAAYALGASKWQTIWTQVLPASAGGILTGVILALSRAVGEAAPLIVVGALAYVPYAPTSPMDNYSVMPIQIFNWISRPQQGFIATAAAGIVALLSITFVMNATAIYLRNRWQKRMKW